LLLDLDPGESCEHITLILVFYTGFLVQISVDPYSFWKLDPDPR
jgi:hypothetical protein